MNQQCKVCGEPAAGFHFGAFTCEGCKSFFGRSYNNLSSISECKNNGECVINKKNRTSCKACRLRKCLLVGMSKSGSRYGRRSNWFKIHCLLQEQQQQQQQKGGVENPLDHRLQFQLASIANKEDLKLFDDYAKSPSVSSPESHNSDSSAELDTRRVLGGMPLGQGQGQGLGPQLFRHHHHHQDHHHLPLLPLVLPHPAFLPPPFPGGHHLSSYSFLGKNHSPFQYDDNFNKRFLVEAVLGVGGRHHEEAPIDLSLKSPERGRTPEGHSEEDEEEDDISVDDYEGHHGLAPSPPATVPAPADLLRRTAPLDLTTKVV